MKPRLILYISGLLIYVIFRSFNPTPTFDTIEIISSNHFKLNNIDYHISEIDQTIRDFRKSVNPDLKYDHIIDFKVLPEATMGIVYDVKAALRKNELRTILVRDKPWWKFWK